MISARHTTNRQSFNKVTCPFKENLFIYSRDFFLNLDNLHDYLKYTFPRMKAPSFFIEGELNYVIKNVHKITFYLQKKHLEIND